MCFLTECKNEGLWQPVLVLRSSEDDDGTKVRFHVPARVATCDAHRATLKPKDFLSPEGFDVLVRHLRERAQAVPIQKLTNLTWEAVQQTDPRTVSQDKAP